MKTKLAFLFSVFCFQFSVWAAGPELTSGYTYGPNSPSNLVTYANLNSHVKDAVLAAGAITNRTAGVFATNFWLLTASNGTLYRIQATNLIPAGFVGMTEISTDVAGLGLGGGGGAALSNKTDNAFLIITNDVLTISIGTWTNFIGSIATNVANTYANYYATNNPTTNSFASYPYSIADGLIANTNHGLATTPRSIQWRLVCTTATVGYAVGDEVLASSLNGDDDSVFILGGNTTNVFAVCGGVANIRIKNKSTGATATFTETNWRLKCYATQ